jgi:hypothetical protein
MKYYLYVLLLLSFIPKSGNAQSADEKLIIGKWVLENDKNRELVFTKTTMFEYYNEKQEDSFSYQIRNDSLITTDKSNSSNIFYYVIQSLTNKYLSFRYLKRGNMLIFRRQTDKTKIN